MYCDLSYLSGASCVVISVRTHALASHNAKRYDQPRYNDDVYTLIVGYVTGARVAPKLVEAVNVLAVLCTLKAANKTLILLNDFCSCHSLPPSAETTVCVVCMNMFTWARHTNTCSHETDVCHHYVYKRYTHTHLYNIPASMFHPYSWCWSVRVTSVCYGCKGWCALTPVALLLTRAVCHLLSPSDCTAYKTYMRCAVKQFPWIQMYLSFMSTCVCVCDHMSKREWCQRVFTAHPAQITRDITFITSILLHEVREVVKTCCWSKTREELVQVSYINMKIAPSLREKLWSPTSSGLKALRGPVFRLMTVLGDFLLTSERNIPESG